MPRKDKEGEVPVASEELRAMPAPDPTHGETSERLALRLAGSGHVPGVPLRHLDFNVLLFLLAQEPTLATESSNAIALACQSDATSVERALGRLHAASLVREAPHPLHPSSGSAVRRYSVNLPRLAELMNAPGLARANPSQGRSDDVAKRGA